MQQVDEGCSSYHHMDIAKLNLGAFALVEASGNEGLKHKTPALLSLHGGNLILVNLFHTIFRVSYHIFKFRTDAAPLNLSKNLCLVNILPFHAEMG